MNKRNVHALSLAACVALLPGMALAFDYSYVEGGYQYRDAYYQNGSGLHLTGSLDIIKPFSAFAEFSTIDNLDQFGAGAMFHAPMLRNLDLYGGASIEHVDSGDESDTGFGLRGGVRWMVIPKLELAPELRYENITDESSTSVRLSGLYDIAPHLMVQSALQVGDDQRFELGLRYNFGGRI